MTDILTRIRNTSVADLEGVRSDFDDVPAPVYRPKAPKNMQRIVPGADDLKPTVTVPNVNAGLVGGTGGVDNRPYLVSTTDRRTEGQARYMDNLISWITEKDADLGRQAREYTDGMTERGLWESGRDSNVSRWIDRLKLKNAELKSAPVVAAPAAHTGDVGHDELIKRETKTGKPRPAYYALRDADGTVTFYRVKAGTKPGWWWIDAQASDEFHPIRNVARKNQILRDIVAAGPEASMRLYGQELGSCGRCHRTLTDETSRSHGIGPECEGMI